MKKALSILMLTFSLVMQGQIYDNSFNPAAEAIRMAPVPNSPEAQAFTKYGNTPVNMYTGTPNIQIPIYTYKGRELDLPISLTYDASGVKVEQLATQVGLSWNLNVGGRISRITNGMPDDFYLSSFTYGPYKSFWDSEVSSKITAYRDLTTNPIFSTQTALLEHMSFFQKVNDNEYDVQPDYFSFSALGQSDMIVIDVASKAAKTLNNPRIKVSYYKPFPDANSPIEKWTVTTDDGVIYTFEATEVTRDVNLNDIGPFNLIGLKKEYNSSWLLTKIESPHSKDIYEFIYTSLGFWGSNRTASSLTGVTNALNCGLNGPSPTNSMGYSNTEYTVSQKVLSEIKHNGKRIININLLSKRWDLSVNSAIEKINIYDDDTNNDTVDLYKSFKFNYDYFRTSTVAAPPYNSSNAPNPVLIRLKLDSIEIKDAGATTLKKYSFNYIDPYLLESTTSKGQDYYGYANGATNSVLYPKEANNSCVSASDGANRDPNFTYAKKGLLNKITYPTGGHTEFEYEANYNNEAGIRVKSIKDYTNATTLAVQKTYQYLGGTVISNPIYTYQSNQYTSDGSNVTSATILHRLSYASGTDKPHVGYGEVIETVEDINNIASNGTTSYYFNTGGGGTYKAGVYTYYINGKETAKNYGVTYNLGKSSGSTALNAQGYKVSSANKTYYDSDYYSNKSVYFLTDESKSDLYPIPTSGPSGWSITYTPGTRIPTLGSVFFGGSGGVGVVPPSGCNSVNFLSYDINKLCTPAVARMTKQNTYAWGKAGNINYSSDTQYYNNEANSKQQVTNYSYYDVATITYLLKETSTTNSFGDTLKQVFEYPTSGSLVTKNILNNPIKSTIYKNAAILSTKNTVFSGTLPSAVQSSKGTGVLEDRVIFHSYYPNSNNVKEVSQKDGTHIVYIWGYNDTKPIAKIENATYTQVSSYVTNLETLSNADKDRTIDIVNTSGVVTSYVGNEGALRSAIKTMRTALSSAMVTSYTYDPLIGVTSITDPRGETIYYQYDTFGRLEFIKDANGKILSTNQYNYKN